MYVCQLTFQCLQEVSIEEAQTAISALLDEYRYNGQIIGREFPVIFNGEQFDVVFVCPEQNALAMEHNCDQVTAAFEHLTDVGLSLPSFELKGLESQSDFTDVCEQPNAIVLYTTYVQSCSPVRCFEHFSPIPLYKLPHSVRKALVKWQESYGACDQLQMNSVNALEAASLAQMSSLDSELMAAGHALMNDIEQQTEVKTYFYLYRVGGDSLEQEMARKCPGCGEDWRLPQPLFDLFDFGCEPCGLVSNLSWDWQ